MEDKIETQTTCDVCKNEATLQTTKLSMPNSQQISTFICPSCNIREVNFYNTDEHAKNSVIIECKFDCAEDMQRYVVLGDMACVTFASGDFKYEYCCEEGKLYVVESFVNQAIEQLIDVFHLKMGTLRSVKEEIGDEYVEETDESSVSLIDKNKLGINKEGLLSSSSIGSIEDKQEAESVVKKFKKMVRNPNFTMIIKDESGYSRVYPVGKCPSDIKGDDLNLYNDSKVTHRSY